MDDNKSLTVNYQGTEHTSVKVKMSVEEFAQFNNATPEEREAMALDVLIARVAKAKWNQEKRQRVQAKRKAIKNSRRTQRVARRHNR